VNTAVYVLNRCLMKSIDGMTPFEAWHGRKTAVHHLRTFGCIVYVRNTTPHLEKLKDHGCKMIFVSYESDSKAYCAYDLIMKHVHVTRDVVFDEQAQWDWGSGSDDGKLSSGDDVFTVEYTNTGPIAPTTDGTDEAPAEESSLPTGVGDTEVDADIDDENLDADHNNDSPLHFHSMSDILVMPGFAPHALAAEELHVYLAIRTGLNGQARSTTELGRHEHGPARKIVGRAGSRPAPDRAQASPPARCARHGTTRLAEPG
jgi:hypothetical protein